MGKYIDDRGKAKIEMMKKIHYAIESCTELKRIENDDGYNVYIANNEKSIIGIREKIMGIYESYKEHNFDISKCIPYISTDKYKYLTLTSKPCIKSLTCKAGHTMLGDYNVEYKRDDLKVMAENLEMDPLFEKGYDKDHDTNTVIVKSNVKLYFVTGIHKYFCASDGKKNVRFRTWAILLGEPKIQKANERKKKDSIINKYDFALSVSRRTSAKFYHGIVMSDINEHKEEIEIYID
ncbi:hypothetical protein PQU95_10275 [Vogesella sp. DC21W]|uniref:Uncharacterized protein n=1 Tax=Vogesella aquatica TaxID=2984206 RepID=A0ABT5IYE1_9NEIS|nr:hypothetical protein [Vogesella aquatica]MDC7717596.1 hypothetical protein [Vogesella aquatica]